MKSRRGNLSPQRTMMLAIDVIRDFAERLLDLEANGEVCELEVKVAVSRGGIRTYRVGRNETLVSIPKANDARHIKERQSVEIKLVKS